MLRALDSIAASASTRIVAWICVHVDESRRDWANAMAAELAAIEGGWRKLGWAIEGLPLAWSLATPKDLVPRFNSRRTTMNDRTPSASRSAFDSFVLNIVTLIAWWMGLTLWIHTQFPHGLTELRVGEIMMLTAATLGTLVALSIRRTGAAYVLAGFVAFLAVELGFHAYFGNHVVQGGPAHFANMTAGILGVTFAALVERSSGTPVAEPIWSAREVFASLFRAGQFLRARIGYSAQLIIGLVAFGTAEISIRGTYGWIWYLNGLGWRWRHLFLDAKSNYAILVCGLCGAALGVAIAKWGSRLTISIHWRENRGDPAAA